MALKYYIEYNDTVNVLHRFELYDDNYTDPSIEVQGYVTMDYGQVDENLEAIRGQGLRVNLEANANLTYDDLFSEQQKTFKVIYYRAGDILFQGWLNSEGFFEDYVNDRWIVSFDCIDGLGYLDNLAFVNSDGTNITGVRSQLEVLSLALRRTGIEQDINVDIDVYYTGLADTESVLENVNVNTRRYIKDDDFTVMNCEEVIRDIIEPYGAVLTSYNGQWAIYKPNQLFSNQTATFFRYDYLGNALSPDTVTFDFSLGLGSRLDGFYPHYCNGNQQFTNKSSFGAYRISYKFGEFRPLIDNDTFYSDDGVTIDGWDILPNPKMTIPSAGESGVTFDDDFIGTTTPSLKSTGVNVDAGVFVSLSSDAIVDADDGLGYNNIGNSIVIISLETTSPIDTYYYNINTQTWTNTGSIAAVFIGYKTGSNSFTDFNINEATPKEGVLKIQYNGASRNALINKGFTLLLNRFSLTIDSRSENNIEGKILTFERTDNPASRIEKTREVFTGDDPTDIYLGTLYKTDGITPTDTWYRKGVTEAVSILELMGSETMRMNANTMRIFSGDVYGYFNYLSVITIDGRTGKFGVTKYSYDTKSNIISAEFKQMFGDELTDLNVDEEFDYGNVVEPTIRG